MLLRKLSLKQYATLFLSGILLFACNTIVFEDLPTATIEVTPVPTEVAEVLFVRAEPDPDRPVIGNVEDRMAGPVLPDKPSQADFGADQYWQRCMACHGDRGQGLTDEWREAWGPEHMDCWQSRCHASNHPPEGFVMDSIAPNIINQFALARFETAQDYYDYIANKMPWWNPGSLDEEVNWQITAFLLRENGVQLTVELNAENASKIIIGNTELFE